MKFQNIMAMVGGLQGYIEGYEAFDTPVELVGLLQRVDAIRAAVPEVDTSKLQPHEAFILDRLPLWLDKASTLLREQIARGMTVYLIRGIATANMGDIYSASRLSPFEAQHFGVP